jgi:hypothetical protein
MKLLTYASENTSVSPAYTAAPVPCCTCSATWKLLGTSLGFPCSDCGLDEQFSGVCIITSFLFILQDYKNCFQRY